MHSFTSKILLLSAIGTLIHASAAVAENRCSLDSILKSSLVSKIEQRAGTVPEWEIPESLTRELHDYWRTSTEPLEDKLTHTYQKVLAARVEGLNPASQALVKLAGRKILNKKGWYQRTRGLGMGLIVGPHYNPIFNSVYLPRDTAKLSDLVIAIHEMEHAVDRNAKMLSNMGLLVQSQELMMLLPTPVGPLNRYAMESRAIGAQWELLQRIPESERWLLRDQFIREAKLKIIHGKDAKEWVKQWSKNGDPQAVRDLENQLLRMESNLEILEKITERSLLYASMTKEEFIREMRTLHGYTLKNLYQRQYEIGSLRMILIISSVSGTYDALRGLVRQSQHEVAEGAKRITFKDLRFYLTLIAAAVTEEPETPTPAQGQPRRKGKGSY